MGPWQQPLGKNIDSSFSHNGGGQGEWGREVNTGGIFKVVVEANSFGSVFETCSRKNEFFCSLICL